MDSSRHPELQGCKYVCICYDLTSESWAGQVGVFGIPPTEQNDLASCRLYNNTGVSARHREDGWEARVSNRISSALPGRGSARPVHQRQQTGGGALTHAVHSVRPTLPELFGIFRPDKCLKCVSEAFIKDKRLGTDGSKPPSPPRSLRSLPHT